MTLIVFFLLCLIWCICVCVAIFFCFCHLLFVRKIIYRIIYLWRWSDWRHAQNHKIKTKWIQIILSMFTFNDDIIRLLFHLYGWWLLWRLFCCFQFSIQCSAFNRHSILASVSFSAYFYFFLAKRCRDAHTRTNTRKWKKRRPYNASQYIVEKNKSLCTGALAPSTE